MDSGQQVQRAHVLKQIDVQTKDIKRGDIFRLTVKDAGGRETQTEFMVALTDAAVDPETGALSLQSDTIHIVAGRPECLQLSVRKGELTRQPLAPQTVPQRQGASPS